MMFEDTYKTISHPSEGLFKDRSSRFISLAFPVKDEEEIKGIIKALKNKYHDARHHCFAYRLGADKSAYRINDDGEPSGTAGKPIYSQILSNDLTNILIVVVRYFGGTKLGVSGLINAYRTAAKEAIGQTTIITKTIKDIYEITFDYALMNDVMKIIKDRELEQLSHHFELSCKIAFSVNKRDSLPVYEIFKKINGLKITAI